jgi:hypothetical protein
MSAKDRSGVNRRSFVRGAALGAAGLAASVPEALADTPPAAAPKPSKAVMARAEAIFAEAGGRFTEDEKKDIIRLLTGAEQTSAKLAAFPLQENSDPAVIFRAFRKEAK